MTADELRAAIETANEDDLIWAVFAEHASGDLELHSLGYRDAFYAAAVFDFDRDLAVMQDVAHVLTGESPIDCADAAAAGVALLDDCARCAAVAARV